MTILCPSCRTAYRVDPERIPEAGVRTRCSTCATVFRLDRSGVAPGTAPAAEPESRRPAGLATPSGAKDAGQAVAPAGGAERRSTPGLPPSAEPRPTPDVPPTGPDPTTAPEEAAASSSDEERAAGLDSAEPAAAEPTSKGPEAAGGVQQDRVAAAGGGVREEQSAAGAASTRDKKPVFGQQDPDTRAERIARALVSDMVVYNSERRDQALAAGTLRSDFKEEILKSWEEYVEQVGEEKAKKSPHFRNALNQILARGQSVF